MSISEHIRIEQRFAALEQEIANLRNALTILQAHQVYSDPSQSLDRRMKAAKAAMPLVNKALPAMEVENA
ncbi:MAG TPA: hypothetical protein VHY35_10510 [Stellaceae bacterium]|jgi:hypothetical protein|nr:hypothetical protein [Stellaceae bacterium]